MCVSENQNLITNILSNYKIYRILELENRVIYELDDKDLILINTIKDSYLKKEVVLWKN